MFRFVSAILISLCALGMTTSLNAADHADHADKTAKDAKPYPFDTCAVSGEAFGGDMGEPHVFVHEGQEVKMCCKGCLKKFNKDPATYIKVIDEGVKAKAAGKTPVNPAAAQNHKDTAHDKHDDHKNHDHGHDD